ncbi:universal stress protein [Hymenobacter sp. BT683]|uniref:Universal stress protein n=1 Tax=Hymenobacter jeongseonensis TaxID=2791027 RepID=A0ABS0IHC2_9BACT|nr:universal stress protein [Hymenobacter jeongseonensis]MBF9237756.1 universal stress protein [Hymenobacter jeongseonensis]
MKPAFAVLTDMSAAAEAALTYTARFAALLNGRVVLLHVYLDPLLAPEVSMVGAPIPITSRQAIMHDLVERANSLPVPADAEVSIDTLEATVADVVRRRHPLLFAIGREQPQNVLDSFLVNLALPTLHHTQFPLLIVPEHWDSPELPSRVVVAADGHDFRLTEPSQALAELLTALRPHATVVHVAAGEGPSHADVGLEAVRQTGLFGSPTGNDLYEVRDESPADGIMLAAKEVGAQLLVVMARPHTFLGGLFHRSVTAKLMHRSPIPVLVLPTTA